MPPFVSAKEKRLWLWAATVLVAILATLFIGRPLANQLRDQNIQAIFFLFGLIMTGAAIVVHALRVKPNQIELSIIYGIVAVYGMFIFRLGAPERSHLIEYSVLAILVHKALIERFKDTNSILKPALLGLTITFLIGVLDESIQLFLPNRVFDVEDIVFNGMATAMAISANVLITWVRTLKSN